VKPLSLQLATPVRLLVLIGGGEFSFGETRVIDEFLIANMQKKSVAFLPTASGSPEYATHFGKYLKEVDAETETVNVPVYRGRDVRRQKSLNMILSAGLVYIGGGVTRTLTAELQETPAELALREAANNGAVVAAIGGAAAAFGVNGFRWIEGAVIDAPFEEDRLRRLMSIPDAAVGIGIPPSTALAIHADGSTEIVGEGTVAVYRKASGA
jgi:cyanophycinase-like exopeptidase